MQVISLKKCGISDDPEEYYLADGMDKDQERELAPDEIPYNIEAKGHAGILRFYMRYCACMYAMPISST